MKMVKVKLSEKVVKGAWFYGGILGGLAPFIYSVLVLAIAVDFRSVYYLRFFLGIVFGVLIGGFSASRLTKYGLKISKHNLISYLALGFFFGAIAGILTLGGPTLMLLIGSSDVEWAINMIVKSGILGSILGSVAGLFFSLSVYFFVGKRD